MLELQTFGGLELREEDGGQIEPLAGRTKCLALLAYLAVEAPDGRVPRQEVAALLWPAGTDERARTSLRKALSQIRQAADPAPVAGEGTSSVGLVRDHVRADVTAFREALEAGEEARALELHAGDFLAGVRVEGARPFQRWADRKRGHLRQQAYEAALSVGTSARETGDLASAESAFRRALDLAPLREEAARELIRTLAERGRPADALQLYEAFRERRLSELEMAPSEELQQRIEELRQAPPSAPGTVGETEPAADGVARASGGSSGDPEPGETVRETGDASTGLRDGDRTGGEPRRWGRFRRRTLLGALVAVGVLGGILAGAWHLMGTGEEAAPPSPDDRSVAVLPFQVSGAAAEEWRDGMVTLLSTGLDGAGGLRAIADRTVFAAWENAGASPGGATIDEALAVARQVGAEHAIVGSAAAVGGELRLTADVHATRSGERLDRVEVRGSSDRVSELTDELTREVIAVLAAETGDMLRAAELASVLTESVAALKLYLSGLEHERAAEYEAALEAYRDAIRTDSTFALPYARIGFMGIWREEARDDHMRRAHQLADRLPERERRLVRALHLGRIEHRTVAAADSLRRLTRDYPDDPSVWRTLGEFVLHAYVPGGWPEGEEAHRRAVRLDPQHMGLYGHYVQPAFRLHRDSALAARRIEKMPDGKQKRLFRLGLETVFGTPGTRERALAAYDTVAVPEPWMAVGPLGAPEDVELRDRVLRRLMERDDPGPTGFAVWLLWNDLQQGRPDQFLDDVERWDPADVVVACFTAHAAAAGLPVPDSFARPYLAPERLPVEPSLQRLGCAAHYGLEKGDTAAVERIVERLRSDGEAGEGSPSAGRDAVIQEIEGFRAWKEGDLERAVDLLGRSSETGVWGIGDLWRGDLYRELGEMEKAEAWYRMLETPVVAYERLGRVYEEMGRPGDAAAAYRRFVAAWEDADARLQPRVEEARERIRELDGSGDGTDE